MSSRHTPRRRRFAVVLVVSALVLTAWSGVSSTAAQESEVANTSLSDYGPTRKAPAGGRLPGRFPGASRWKYRGQLGKLGNNEQVVPPAAPPPRVPAGRAPLTGLKAKGLDRRALIVKIDNVRPARPQTAINQADIVYEELVEAGVTRLAAVFHSKRPSLIGPVRSARSTDIGIAVSFRKPVFAFSGANSIVEKLVARARLVDRGNETFGGYFRLRGRSAPNNLYTTASRMLASAKKGKPPPAQFEYRSNKASPGPDVPTARTIQLRFVKGAGVKVRYEWDPQIGGWRRWQNGSPHRDSAGVQVAPENVIVQIVPYIDAGMTDKFNEDLYEAQMVGTGEALVFTAGHVYAATWTKSTLRSVTTYTDENGEHIKLTKGRTWVALVPPGGVTFNSYKCKGQIATVAGTPGDDILRGTDSRDIIAGTDGSDTIFSGGGDDLVCGGKGSDRIFGEGGNDVLYGGPSADDLRGGDGADRLIGGGGNDQLRGDAGADYLRGRGGADQLYGQVEVDNIAPGKGDVVVRGW